MLLASGDPARMGQIENSGAVVVEEDQGISPAYLRRLPTASYRRPSNPDATAPTQCPVCLCDFEEGDQVRYLPCLHQFHVACVDKWLLEKATCPICKLPLRGRPGAADAPDDPPPPPPPPPPGAGGHGPEADGPEADLPPGYGEPFQ
ncbi:hypothetical protein PAPYR_7460 [Paratrimastix pyriformis]|uniref:RING-type domain-containing protein n=1 Tax=Paratrimastix pyriformis TaxID=342808 RepID=A0ABQ8UFH0_9EUKA|nr:hypothetical protein PAPYR_7460 [Paratrimastix pyriformis]